MKKSFERFKKIVKETENMIHEFPGIKRFDAFKRAVAKVKFLEEQEYAQNGNLVDDLIGTHNPDPTY